jgi:hypothetical protein
MTANAVELAERTARGLPATDVVAGSFTVDATRPTAPVFLRLAPESEPSIDRARATYLLLANAHLRAGTAGWQGGPGMVTGPDADPALLGRELLELAAGIRVLGDERVAAAYLALVEAELELRVPLPRRASTEGGSE